MNILLLSLVVILLFPIWVWIASLLIALVEPDDQ